MPEQTIVNLIRFYICDWIYSHTWTFKGCVIFGNRAMLEYLSFWANLPWVEPGNIDPDLWGFNLNEDDSLGPSIITIRCAEGEYTFDSETITIRKKHLEPTKG